MNRSTKLSEAERLERLLSKVYKIDSETSHTITESSIIRIDKMIYEIARTCEDKDNLHECYFWINRKLSPRPSFSGYFLDSFQLGIKKNKELFICENCDSVEDRDGSIYISDLGYDVCVPCLDSGSFCWDEKNDEMILSDNAITVIYARRSSYVTHKDSIHKYACKCSDCGEYYDINQVSIYSHVNGSEICEYCSENYYFDEDGTLYNEPPQREEDYDSSNPRKSLWNNTKDDWTINPKRKHKRDLFLGVEIETEIQSDSILDDLFTDSINLNDNFDSEDLESGRINYCLKSDGSLGNNGVEIVFHHDRPKNIRRNIENFFTKNKKGIRAWDKGEGYGIHVHLEKKNLSLLTQERILQFFLTDYNEDFIKFIARRKPNSYWSFRYDENYETCKIKKSKMLLENCQKYRAIYANRKTLEFRIFRSTTKFSSIMVYLEFVLCLAHYCKRSESQDYHEFLKFIDKKSKIFPHLSETVKKFTQGKN